MPDTHLILIKIYKVDNSVIFAISQMKNLRLKELNGTAMAPPLNQWSTVWHRSLGLNQPVMPTFKYLSSMN